LLAGRLKIFISALNLIKPDLEKKARIGTLRSQTDKLEKAHYNPMGYRKKAGLSLQM
jgi:hypothetical protein